MSSLSSSSPKHSVGGLVATVASESSHWVLSDFVQQLHSNSSGDPAVPKPGKESLSYNYGQVISYSSIFLMDTTGVSSFP